MSKSGQSNAAFIADENSSTNDKATNGTTLELQLQGAKKVPDDDNYDPYKNRCVSHPTTSSETLLHFMKGSLGTGILAMPLAFEHAGWLVGIIATVVIGSICTYCIHMLLAVHYELCKRRKVPSMSYPSIAEAALLEGPPFFRKFSTTIVHISNTFLLIYQLGICCVYVVFVSSNIKAVADQYVEPISVRYYMLMILLPLILLNWVKNLKYLVPFSTFANGITVVTFGIILYYIFRDAPTFEGKHAVGKLHDFPLFFGTVLFSLEAIGVIMPLENEMKNPKKFKSSFGVLNIGMTIIVSFYIGMGFFGYLKYDHPMGSITLNLDETEKLAQAVKLLLAFAIFISYALQCYVAVDIVWSDYISPHLSKTAPRVLYEYIVRTVLVLLTFLLAVAVPNLELFISLFGALCLSMLGMIIPAITETTTYWYHVSTTKFIFMVAKNILICLFGVCGLIVGTYTAMSEIIDKFG